MLHRRGALEQVAAAVAQDGLAGLDTADVDAGADALALARDTAGAEDESRVAGGLVHVAEALVAKGGALWRGKHGQVIRASPHGPVVVAHGFSSNALATVISPTVRVPWTSSHLSAGRRDCRKMLSIWAGSRVWNAISAHSA